jgi:hypothetical protein
VTDDVSDVVVLESVVITGAEVVILSTSVVENDLDVVELDTEGLVEDEMTSVVSEVVPDEEEDDDEDKEDELIEIVTEADELVEDDTVLVDESVTDDTMVALVLLRPEVVGTSGELKLDIKVLTSELVTMVEELVAEGTVLEIDIEVEDVTDRSVTGRTTFELDELPRLDLVEMTDEFEIGYKTLNNRG